MALTWLPEGTTPKPSDNQQRSLWKMTELIGGYTGSPDKTRVTDDGGARVTDDGGTRIVEI